MLLVEEMKATIFVVWNLSILPVALASSHRCRPHCRHPQPDHVPLQVFAELQTWLIHTEVFAR
jgi:hypothetical protein